MSRDQVEAIAQEQLELAGMIERDEQLAYVAINSFVTAFELLRPNAA